MIMVEDMQSEEIGELVSALVKAQTTIKAAKKDSSNSFFNNKYADLTACIEASRPALLENGLTVIQTMSDGHEAGVTVVTTLAHTSGQWIKGFLHMTPKETNNPQQIGSCITYARRYALAAIVGLTQEDDDGNKASQPKKTTSSNTRQNWRK